MYLIKTIKGDITKVTDVQAIVMQQTIHFLAAVV